MLAYYLLLLIDKRVSGQMLTVADDDVRDKSGREQMASMIHASVSDIENNMFVGEDDKNSTCDNGDLVSSLQGKVTCVLWPSTDECCLNLWSMASCEESGVLAPGMILGGFCRETCGFCENKIEAEKSTWSDPLIKNVQIDRSRILPRVVLLLMIFTYGIALIITLFLSIAIFVCIRHKKVSWRSRTRAVLLLLHNIHGMILVGVGTGLVNYSFETPDIYMSDVTIDNFTVDISLFGVSLDISYYIIIEIDALSFDIAVLVQESILDIDYVKEPHSRQIGIMIIPDFTIRPGEINVIRGLVEAMIQFDAISANWIASDVEDGSLDLRIGPEDLSMTLKTKDKIFDWVVGANGQEVVMRMECSLSLLLDMNDKNADALKEELGISEDAMRESVANVLSGGFSGENSIIGKTFDMKEMLADGDMEDPVVNCTELPNQEADVDMVLFVGNFSRRLGLIEILSFTILGYIRRKRRRKIDFATSHVKEHCSSVPPVPGGGTFDILIVPTAFELGGFSI